MGKKWILLLVFALLVIFIIIFIIVRNHRNNHEIVLFGNVDVRQVEISFRIAGQVGKLYHEEGDLVTAGTPLASLDHAPYDSQLNEAKSRLSSTEVRFKNAEILYNRRKELIGSGSVSQEELDDATATYQSLLADLAAAKAAQIIAEENLSYTTIYAPNEGIILSRIREPGSVVNPTDSIYTLSLTRPLWIRAYVSERNLGRIHYGMKAKVTTDTAGAPTYIGTIGFISPVAEFTPKTVQTVDLRTDLVYRLRIYIDEIDCRLKQGMPVTIHIEEECDSRTPHPT